MVECAREVVVVCTADIVTGGGEVVAGSGRVIDIVIGGVQLGV